jgi:hypothetical protein
MRLPVAYRSACCLCLPFLVCVMCNINLLHSHRMQFLPGTFVSCCVLSSSSCWYSSWPAGQKFADLVRG